MARMPIDQRTQTIQLRGITFPVDCIRAAMLETGGKVVSDPEINKALDAVLFETIALGKEPEMLYIESIPAVTFIPKRVTLYIGPTDTKGVQSERYLYFAVPRLFNA